MPTGVPFRACGDRAPISGTSSESMTMESPIWISACMILPPGPGGKIMHAEIQIGDSIVMLSDEVPEMGARSPQALNGTPVGIFLYVENVDATFKQEIGRASCRERSV